MAPQDPQKPDENTPLDTSLSGDGVNAADTEQTSTAGDGILSDSSVDAEPNTSQAAEELSSEPVSTGASDAVGGTTSQPLSTEGDGADSSGENSAVDDISAEPATKETLTNPDAPAPAMENVDPAVIAAAAPMMTAPVASEPQKKSPKKLILIIVAIVVGSLLIGCGVAFAVWYNSPQKVLNDSLGNLVNTLPKAVDATMAVNSDDTDVKITLSSSADDSENSQANVKLNVSTGSLSVDANVDAIAAKNGDIYIRINDAKKLVTQLSQGSPDVATMFEGVLKKVDTKWVKISKDDVKSLDNSDNADSECVNQAIASFQSDAAQKKEVGDLYAKNQFVTVKEQKADEAINGHNSYHYVLDTDETKAKAFGEGMKQTQVYKKIKDCLGDSFKDSDSTSSDSSDDAVSSLEVWIDKSNRQINKIAVAATSEKQKFTVKADATLGYQAKTITLPTTTTSLDEIKQEITNSLLGGMSASDTANVQTTVR